MYLNRSFPGVKKGGGGNGEVKGGEEWESEQGLKGKEGGKMSRKGWRKGARKNSDFGTPLI